jgi:hypothetical protein
MRKFFIFVFFWLTVTLSLRLKEIYAIIFLLPAFLILYNLAEQLDEDN